VRGRSDHCPAMKGIETIGILFPPYVTPP